MARSNGKIAFSEGYRVVYRPSNNWAWDFYFGVGGRRAKLEKFFFKKAVVLTPQCSSLATSATGWPQRSARRSYGSLLRLLKLLCRLNLQEILLSLRHRSAITINKCGLLPNVSDHLKHHHYNSLPFWVACFSLCRPLWCQQYSISPDYKGMSALQTTICYMQEYSNWL